VPPHPEYDLLWFIANYAPELEQWERDIFLAVRAESLYFYPVFACQIMNEGWASYWHARLLREADFLPQQTYLAAIKAHSDVVRPFASGEETALAINPYHLGFTLWERIVERHGMASARQVMREEDDFGFIQLPRPRPRRRARPLRPRCGGDEIRAEPRPRGGARGDPRACSTSALRVAASSQARRRLSPRTTRSTPRPDAARAKKVSSTRAALAPRCARTRSTTAASRSNCSPR
jgi:hypothetical protein